jgi:hypothetical protein
VRHNKALKSLSLLKIIYVFDFLNTLHIIRTLLKHILSVFYRRVEIARRLQCDLTVRKDRGSFSKSSDHFKILECAPCGLVAASHPGSIESYTRAPVITSDLAK